MLPPSVMNAPCARLEVCLLRVLRIAHSVLREHTPLQQVIPAFSANSAPFQLQAAPTVLLALLVMRQTITFPALSAVLVSMQPQMAAAAQTVATPSVLTAQQTPFQLGAPIPTAPTVMLAPTPLQDRVTAFLALPAGDPKREETVLPVLQATTPEAVEGVRVGLVASCVQPHAQSAMWEPPPRGSAPTPCSISLRPLSRSDLRCSR